MSKLNSFNMTRLAVHGWLGIAFMTCLSARAESAQQVLTMQTHAAFFSTEMHQKIALDPQVFILEPTAPAAVGAQGIKHLAGLRNALMTDAPNLPLLDASGRALGMTLGAWLGAKGDVIFSTQANGQQKVTLILSGLKPKGHYSLFENHFDQKPLGFTPLDGDGVDNDFIADNNGKAVVNTVAPTPLTHANAVLLVYHSDQKSHGKLRGEIGSNAFHQLIVRP